MLKEHHEEDARISSVKNGKGKINIKEQNIGKDCKK
jgi:hypothetical protein